ncbi:MAG: tetratricopeptide repeat protein, partial [Desulfobacterales bacterium]
NTGKPQKAMEDFNQAIQLDPDLAEAYYNRGVGHINTGRYNLACQDFQKACELGDCAYLRFAQRKEDCP